MDMHTRLLSLARALKASRPGWQRFQGPQRPYVARFICQGCQRNFSAASALHKIRQVSRRTLSTAAKDAKAAAKDAIEQKYPAVLTVYDAGSTRTGFVIFWKTIALLQFGTCAIFLAPMLYNNPNQPDKTIRTFQAVGVTLLSTIPSGILSFLTAPYVNRIAMFPVPPAARGSLTALRSFARNIPPTTKITFQTLRFLPMPKYTTVYAQDLRALAPRRFRFANIELPKTDEWRKKQAAKSWWRKIWDIIGEPRNKFYVKEGSMYTMRSGVPGVWETLASGIAARTSAEQATEKANKMAAKQEKENSGTMLSALRKARPAKPVKKVEVVQRPALKRQTARRV